MHFVTAGILRDATIHGEMHNTHTHNVNLQMTDDKSIHLQNGSRTHECGVDSHRNALLGICCERAEKKKRIVAT